MDKKQAVYPVTPLISVEEAADKLTNQDCKLEKIPVEVVDPSPYDPNYAFTHQEGMAFFKGKLYVIFSRGEKDEDFPGQEMVIVSSDNFYDWSAPQVIAPSHQGTYGKTTIITGCLYSTEDKLYAYFVEHDWGALKYPDGVFNMDTPYEGTISRKLMICTEDGINWSEPVDVCGSAHESPRQTLTGEWLASWGSGMMYSDAPDGQNWELVGLTNEQRQRACDRGATMLGECSWYQMDDYVINMVLRSDVKRDGKQVFEAFLAQSYDGGKTWTDAYPAHNFRLDWHMLYMGRFPDNSGYYFVGTTHPDSNPRLPEYNRYPLYLMVSKDGYDFTKGYILRDDVYVMKQEGHAKGGQYGYPEVTIHDGYLYVLCSRMKEYIELTRVKLTDIKM